MTTSGGKIKMNNKPISKLGIGPMSSEIIEATYRYSSVKEIPLMLIASKNQIDWSGGYVNNWNTRKYMIYVSEMKKRYPKARIYICRDHCGPGFNNIYDLKDTYETIDSDIENGFDLIHIDLCHFNGSRRGMFQKSKEIIEYIKNKSKKVLIEIGTDENTGKSLKKLNELEHDIKYFSQFCKPSFYVCQTGTVVKEIGQFGKFNKQYVRSAKKLFDKYGFYIKEHNADYLSKKEIQERRNLVGAQNVAPQFGVLQTTLTLKKCFQYGINPGEFLEDSYRGKKWEKWLSNNTGGNKMLCSVIAGHYNFSTTSYKRIYGKIQKHENFAEAIVNEIMKTIELYIDNLS
jgi:hypothetical protein